MLSPRTKDMVGLLQRLDLAATVLLLLPDVNENVELAARNLPYVKTQRATLLSVRDLLGYDYILLTTDAVDMIHNMLGAEV
jgi:large subunit ribosomal protein L4